MEEAHNIISQIKFKKGKPHITAMRIEFFLGLLFESKSDDGEPNGTAGAPMLQVLAGAHLVNVLAICTRYFGGTKLGTGGLARAYSDSVKKAIESTELIIFKNTENYCFSFPIQLTDTINHYLNKKKIAVITKDFGNSVTYTISVTQEEKEVFQLAFSGVINDLSCYKDS